MAVIIPFNPTRHTTVPFSQETFTASGLTPRWRIKDDAEGSGYRLVEALLPPSATYALVLEMMQRFMTQAPAKRRNRKGS